eukprot:5846397-Pyramimonas_sp.AAC.1
MSPGKEPRAGYPARKGFPEPVRAMRVVQHCTCPLELLVYPVALPRPVSVFLSLPRPPCARGQDMSPAIVRRAGCWWAVMSPGNEPRVGYPTRKRLPEPVRAMRVVQH